MAAEKITPDAINFMAKFGLRPYLLAAYGDPREKLHLPLIRRLTRASTAQHLPKPLTRRVGVTTASAHLIAQHRTHRHRSENEAAGFRSPRSHLSASRSGNESGVLVARRKTEAVRGLARHPACIPAGVICEIMSEKAPCPRAASF